MSRKRIQLICCLTYGTALALCVAASLGVGANDKKCGTVAITGCGDVAAYCCTSWNGYTCSQGGGTSSYKEGVNYPYNLCFTQQNSNCEEQSLVCFKDIYYKDSGCTVYCAEFATYIDGCVPPPAG